MNIQFENNMFTDMQEQFNQLNQEEAIFMSHYQLADNTEGFSADQWKQFLNEPQVAQWLGTEIEMYKDYQLRQMIKDASKNDRSVGAASMINSLTKSLHEGRTKDGPVIIYTHVPLTPQQQATSVEHHEATHNIFLSPDVEEAEEWED